MYTSAHEANAAEYLKRAKIYLILAIVCCLIGAVYEHFSFGVYSYFMLYAFAVPLLCGALPALLLASSRRPRTIPQWSMKLADAGIAAWTVGSFFRGILEIYGTASGLTKWYWIAGSILLLSAAVLYVTQRVQGHSKKIPN